MREINYAVLNRKFCLDFVEDTIKLSEKSIKLSIKLLEFVHDHLYKISRHKRIFKKEIKWRPTD